MFRQINDFLADWDYESRATTALLRNLTDAALEQRVTPQGRSAGKLAWHITQSIAGMGQETGLHTTGPGEDDPTPATAAAIATRYGEAACSLAGAVKAQWTDEMLTGEIPMYGEMWPRGKALSAIIRHEAHHRGQLTVLMRQAGLTVPGTYGPSREEWAGMGLPPQD